MWTRRDMRKPMFLDAGASASRRRDVRICCGASIFFATSCVCASLIASVHREPGAARRQGPTPVRVETAPRAQARCGTHEGPAPAQPAVAHILTHPLRSRTICTCFVLKGPFSRSIGPFSSRHQRPHLHQTRRRRSHEPALPHRTRIRGAAEEAERCLLRRGLRRYQRSDRLI